MSLEISRHAAERLEQRFDVKEEDYSKWVADNIERAYNSYTQNFGGRKQRVYQGRIAEIVVDEIDNKVITVKPTVKVDRVADVLAREYRSLYRENTRMIRKIEVEVSELYSKLSDRMLSFARAKNPNTRESIGQDIEEVEREIKRKTYSIRDLEDEIKGFSIVQKKVLTISK